MALAKGTGKLTKYAWSMNEIGKDNCNAALSCTKASQDGRIDEFAKEIREAKEAKKKEALGEKIGEFREIFGEEEEERE